MDDIFIFEPKVHKGTNYAVAMPMKEKFFILETHDSIEDLISGYERRCDIADQKGFTKPYPIEIIDPNGECRILEEISGMGVELEGYTRPSASDIVSLTSKTGRINGLTGRPDVI